MTTFLGTSKNFFRLQFCPFGYDFVRFHEKPVNVASSYASGFFVHLSRLARRVQNFASKKVFRGALQKIILLMMLTLFPSSALPAGRADANVPQQYRRDFSIRDRVRGTMLIIGTPAYAADIQKLEDMAVTEAGRVYDLLDESNPSSEVALLNANSGKGKMKVSWQVLDAFKTALNISQMTNGVFDIVGSKGDYRSISIDDKNSAVELKKQGSAVNFDGIIDGYIADYITNMIYIAKMENALVKANNAFRGLGRSIQGPWAIQVEEESSSMARHALNLTLVNTGMATVSATKFQGQAKSKGATIIMNDAASAAGLAYAVMTMNPTEGLALLQGIGKARGLIVDQNGVFLRTPGL